MKKSQELGSFGSSGDAGSAVRDDDTRRAKRDIMEPLSNLDSASSSPFSLTGFKQGNTKSENEDEANGETTDQIKHRRTPQLCYRTNVRVNSHTIRRIQHYPPKETKHELMSQLSVTFMNVPESYLPKECARPGQALRFVKLPRHFHVLFEIFN